MYEWFQPGEGEQLWKRNGLADVQVRSEGISDHPIMGWCRGKGILW